MLDRRELATRSAPDGDRALGDHGRGLVLVAGTDGNAARTVRTRHRASA
jgi:hypothetical protein